MILPLLSTPAESPPKPPGAQIKRWYIILILLVFLINLSAIVSLFLVQKALNDIINRHEPLVKSAEVINAEVLEAQLYLSRYLSEDEKDLTKAYAPLEAALAEAEGARLKTQDPALLKDLEEIKTSTAKFRKALSELKAARGGRNWRQVEQFRRAAVSLGKETQTHAQKIKNETYKQIEAQNRTSLLTARVVFSLILMLFLVSLAVIWAVLYWWKRFQDVLLEI